MSRTIAMPVTPVMSNEHVMKLQIHLGQGFLDAINAGGGCFNHGLAMAHREGDHQHVVSPRKKEKRRIEYAENQQTYAAGFE